MTGRACGSGRTTASQSTSASQVPTSHPRHRVTRLGLTFNKGDLGLERAILEGCHMSGAQLSDFLIQGTLMQWRTMAWALGLEISRRKLSLTLAWGPVAAVGVHKKTCTGRSMGVKAETVGNRTGKTYSPLVYLGEMAFRTLRANFHIFFAGKLDSVSPMFYIELNASILRAHACSNFVKKLCAASGELCSHCALWEASLKQCDKRHKGKWDFDLHITARNCATTMPLLTNAREHP